MQINEKRLQKEFKINVHVIRGKVDANYVKSLAPFEFQNWVIVDKFLGKASPRKSGDMGIDGYTPEILGGYPIQVKQSEGVGRNVVDNFETAIRRINKTKGTLLPTLSRREHTKRLQEQKIKMAWKSFCEQYKN